jgi:AraC family L-rhamnose operon transcriptional activator RhaR/AraC family L-rhamnose operon regulatory protein RhaS
MPRRLRSNKVFPIPDFPLRVMRAPNHGDTSLHAHEFTELVIIFQGQGRHVTDEGSYPISMGDVFVIRGGHVHGYTGQSLMSLVNILFSPRRLRLPIHHLGGLSGYHVLFRIEPKLRTQGTPLGPLRLAPTQLAHAGELLAGLEDELGKRRAGFRFVACARLMELVGFLCRCYRAPKVAERRPWAALGEVLSYMEGHFGEELTVKDLAREGCMSESTLTRHFRHILGRPPIDYLIGLRIAKATEMLQREELRITDVAFRCGFSDSNYFSRQFRKIMNLSPRDYRARMRREH